MKNIYKTIIVWLLTAIIGSTVLAIMIGADEAGHTGRFSLENREVAIVGAIAAVVCLGLSLPATLFYHFLAVRLYERWDNIVKVKLTLGLYAVAASFVSVLIVGLVGAGSIDNDWMMLSIPYAIGSLIASLIFSYRSGPVTYHSGDGQQLFPESEEAEEEAFPKEMHAVIIFITVLLCLWNVISMFRGRFYGGSFSLTFPLLLFAALIAGLVLFVRKNVAGWYMLFGFFMYGTVSTLLTVLTIIGRYRGSISGQTMIQTVFMLVVCDLVPLVLIITPKMTRYFKVKKNPAILTGIIAALLVAGLWLQFMIH